jgi:thiol:disulfide interchange protein DsbC
MTHVLRLPSPLALLLCAGLFVAVLGATMARAQPAQVPARPATVPAAAAVPAAVDQAIRAAITAKFPKVKVESVSRTSFPGVLELVVDGNIFYTDDKFTYVMQGRLIETSRWEDITARRAEEIEARLQGPINFRDLPLDIAVKTVRGNGRRVIATFEDPNCGFCRQFFNEVAKLNDVTIYTFLYPIISPEDSTAKSRAVWCSRDRAKAWAEVMTTGKIAPAPQNCSAPTDRILDLGRKLNVSATPTLFLADGRRLRGMKTADELERELAAPPAKGRR